MFHFGAVLVDDIQDSNRENVFDQRHHEMIELYRYLQEPSGYHDLYYVKSLLFDDLLEFVVRNHASYRRLVMYQP